MRKPQRERCVKHLVHSYAFSEISGLIIIMNLVRNVKLFKSITVVQIMFYIKLELKVTLAIKMQNVFRIFKEVELKWTNNKR